MSRFLLAVPLFALLVTTSAQTVEFAVAYPAAEAGDLRAEVAFADVPVEGTEVGLRLAAGQVLVLGLRLREAGSLATIGNLITSLAADVSSGGRYAVTFNARGVLGPAAVRLRASVHDALPPLAPLGEGEFAELPLLGAGPPVLGLQAGVRYRVSRELIIDVAPGIYLRSAELGASLSSEARLVRLHGRNDLTLLLNSFAEPGFDRASVAVGSGYTINRRRAPSWMFAVWLGLGPDGVAPGATVRGGARSSGGEIDLLLAAEPYRVDVWPYRADVDYEMEVGSGDLVVGLRAGLQPQAGWQAGGRLAYRLPFEP